MEGGLYLVSMKAEDIKKISVDSEATIRDVMKAIGNGVVGASLVVDDAGKLISLVTDGDLRRALLAGHGLETKISLLELYFPVVANVQDSADEVSGKFSEKVRILPVINSEGIVVDIHFYDKRTNIAVAKPYLNEDEIELVNECIVTGWVSSGGKFVTQFEQEMARFCGVKYAVTCSSGTTALHLLLVAAGICAGDEVIVPSLSFIATANAVSYTGAKPVFVDSEQQSWNIDPELIESRITEKTRAIIPVHLYGLPADMKPILEIANRHGLMVFEDCAESHGARYKGAQTGSLANAGVFSFFGNKIITTGEGGMIVTDDDALASQCRLLRDHGMSPERRYWHPVIGFNYRMTNIQAALGVAQLGKIQHILDRKKEIARLYMQGFSQIQGITLPTENEFFENVYWLFTILVDEQVFGMTRDKIMEVLSENRIDSRPIFPPMHKQPVYDHGEVLPVCETISASGISLPSSVDISNDDINRICNLFKNLFTAESLTTA